MLIVLQLAFSVFGPNNPITQMLNSVVAWLPHLAVALIIVVVAALIARAVRELASEALGGLSYGKVLANTAGVFIVGLGIIAALNQIGVAAVTLPILIAVLAAVAAFHRRCRWRSDPPDAAAVGGLAGPAESRQLPRPRGR